MANPLQEKLGPVPLWMWGLGGIGAVLIFKVLKGSGSSSSNVLVPNPSTTAGGTGQTGGTDTSSIEALLTQMGQAEQQSFQQLATSFQDIAKQQQDAMTALGQANLAQTQALEGGLTALGKSQSDAITALSASLAQGQQSLLAAITQGNQSAAATASANQQAFQQELLSLMNDLHQQVAQPAPPVYNPSVNFGQPAQVQQSSFNPVQTFQQNLAQLLATQPIPTQGQQLTTQNFYRYNTLSGQNLAPSNLAIINNTQGGQSLASRTGAGVPVVGPGGVVTYFRPQIAIS